MPGVSRALREVIAATVAASLLLVFASSASAASAGAAVLNGTRMLSGEKSTVTTTKLPNGAKRLKYEIGPFKVIPGQNEIGYEPITAKPQVDGYITRMRPDLTYMDGKVPRVDVLHLHHGVWVNLSRPNTTNNLPELFFAAGEEKTIFQLPKGYGYRYEASDNWLLNHMIHNLTPIAKEVKMVYEIDFIPDTSPAAKNIKPARPIWMDVESGKIYPVFNVLKNSGKKNIFTYPNDDPNAYPARPPAQRLDRRPRRRPPRHGRPPASGRPAHRPVARARRRQGARGQVRAGQDGQGRQEVSSQVATRQGRQGPPVQVGRQVLRACRRGVVGRRDDRDAARLEGRGQAGRRARPRPPPTAPSAAPGGSRWGSWSPTWPTRPGRARTPTAHASTSPASPRTGTCARTATTAGRRPTCPTRAS